MTGTNRPTCGQGVFMSEDGSSNDGGNSEASPSGEGVTTSRESAPQGSTDLSEATDVKENVTVAGAPRTFQVKVDGEEVTVTEEELLRGYQLRKASDKRFSEGHQMRKQSEEFIRLLKTDPKKVLSHPSIGLDLKNFAEEYLMGQMQEEMMSPEEKKLKEYQEKLRGYEEAEANAKKEEETKQEKAVREKYTADYNNQIITALEQSGLPKTEFTVKRMINYMHSALQKGYELEGKDVVDLVKQDYINDTKALYSNLDADSLMDIIGPDMAKKIREYDLNKVKKPTNNVKDGAVPKRKDDDGTLKKSKKMSPQAWRDMVNKNANS